MLQYTSDGPVTPVSQWATPLYPDAESGYGLLGAAVRSGLLVIHEDSPVDAFVWEEGDGSKPRLTSSFYPSRAFYYVPFGPSLDTAAKRTRDELAERLDPATSGVERTSRLVEAAADLLQLEAIRYFSYLLADHNLPEVPEQHRDRFRDAAGLVARNRPLAQVYNIAWRAVRAAAASRQQTRAPGAAMSTFAVNQFDRDTSRAATDQEWELKPFNPDSNVPLSHTTWALFRGLLDLHPMYATIADVEEQIAQPRGFASALAAVARGDFDGQWLDLLEKAISGRRSTTDSSSVIRRGGLRVVKNPD
jgi:hypothetical protein